MTTTMVSSVNIALPTIGKYFEVSAVMLSWVATAYLLTAAIFLVPFGRMADILGRKRVFIWGIMLYTLSSAAAALSPSALFLIITRAIQGVSGSMVFGIAVAILTSVFPPGERGKALGFNLAATYTGLSLGPFLGGLLTHQLGWRSIFWFSSIFSAFIIPMIIISLRSEWADAKGEKFDWKGSVVYSLGLFGIMYGFSLFPSLNGVVLLLSGVAVMGFFVFLEKSVPFPVLNVHHLRKNLTFIFSSLAAFINYSATFAIGFMLSLYLQYIQGLNPRDAGLILVAQPVTMALFSPLAGRLSDKIEPRVVATIGMALTAGGMVPLIFLSSSTSIIYIIITLLVIGIGFALFSSPNTNAIMSSVEKKYYGIASAAVGTMRLTGQVISMGIAMLVFSLVIGKVKITPEYYPQFLLSTRYAFIIFTSLCFAGIFASLARGNVR